MSCLTEYYRNEVYQSSLCDYLQVPVQTVEKLVLYDKLRLFVIAVVCLKLLIHLLLF